MFFSFFLLNLHFIGLDYAGVLLLFVCELSTYSIGISFHAKDNRQITRENQFRSTKISVLKRLIAKETV